MASTVVTGQQSDDLDAVDAVDEDAPPPGDTDCSFEADAPPPLDWSVNADGGDLADFFGPEHGRLNRVAIGVVAAILIIAVILALVIGTSGGSKNAGTPSRTTAHGGAAAAATVTNAKAKGAKATAGLLTVADFPAGWTSAGTATVTHSPAWSKPLASCVGVPGRVANTTPPKASSPVFTSTDKTAALEETVSQYATRAQALAEYKAIASAKTAKCINSVGATALRASIQSEAGSSATVGNVIITPIPPGTLKANETGIRVTIPLSTNAGTLTINSTEVDFVKGTLFEQLNFNGNGTPFPPLLEVQLIDAAMHRAGS